MKAFRLLFLLVFFVSCQHSVQKKTHLEVVSPEYKLQEEELKKAIAGIIPAEEFKIFASKTESTGKREYSTLHLEIVHPDKFPGNARLFKDVSEKIHEIITDELQNLDAYKNLEIVVRTTVKDHDTEHDRTYKRVVEL